MDRGSEVCTSKCLYYFGLNIEFHIYSSYSFSQMLLFYDAVLCICQFHLHPSVNDRLDLFLINQNVSFLTVFHEGVIFPVNPICCFLLPHCLSYNVIITLFSADLQVIHQKFSGSLIKENSCCVNEEFHSSSCLRKHWI